MAQVATKLRDLLRMARMLREAATVTHEQTYIDKFNRAAAELEHRAHEIAGVPDGEPLPSDEAADPLHAPVDIRV